MNELNLTRECVVAKKYIPDPKINGVSNAIDWLSDDWLTMFDELQRYQKGIREVVEDITKWADSYPLSVFPEPDLKKANEILGKNGMTLDAISASVLRLATADFINRLQKHLPETNNSSDMTNDIKQARGVLPWKEGDEPAEKTVRRMRDGETSVELTNKESEDK